MHVNVYTYSQVKNLKIAPVQNKAVGFVLECITGKGPVTRTETHLLQEYAEESNKNHAELIVIAEALKHMKTPESITIYTDNQFIAGQFGAGNVENWEKNGWKNSAGKEITNRCQWQKVLNMTRGRKVEWVAGENHSYRAWMEKEVAKERNYICDSRQ